jgi:hypothetical protein
MKKLLLASVLAIASVPGYAQAPDYFAPPQCDKFDGGEYKACVEQEWQKQNPRADNSTADEVPHGPRVTVTPPPYQGPPPIGWIYAPYAACLDPPRCSIVAVNVGADGLNVRATPNGPPVMALVNGTLLIPVGPMEGKWALVAPACDLTPTFAWSWTAGVPLNRCWVYF